jgi:hypothetical protein
MTVNLEIILPDRYTGECLPVVMFGIMEIH